MGAKIEIDKESCTSCKTCVKACFIDILRWDEVEQETSRRLRVGVRVVFHVRNQLPGPLHQRGTRHVRETVSPY